MMWKVELSTRQWMGVKAKIFSMVPLFPASSRDHLAASWKHGWEQGRTQFLDPFHLSLSKERCTVRSTRFLSCYHEQPETRCLIYQLRVTKTYPLPSIPGFLRTTKGQRFAASPSNPNHLDLLRHPAPSASPSHDHRLMLPAVHCHTLLLEH